MKVHHAKQGSPAWLLERMCRPTASELDNLITPKFEPRKWSTAMPNSYLASKLAERWYYLATGNIPEGFMSLAMENGAIREQQAIPWYEGIYECTIERVGLIVSDDGLVACSPDGMFSDGTGIEVKHPEIKAHTKYLLRDEVPEEYLVQVHSSIYVCNAPRWTFLSWRSEFPKLVVVADRDERKFSVLREVIEEFAERFKAGWARMEEMNGGPPTPPAYDVDVADDGTVTKTMAGAESDVMQWLRNGDRRNGK